MPARARVPILPIQHFISITANQLVALLPDEHCSAAEEPTVRRLSAGGRWIRTSGSARARTTPGSASCALPGQSNAPAARARLERDQAAPGFGEEGEHCRRTRYREDG